MNLVAAFKVAGITVFKGALAELFYFVAPLMIDDDGDPKCYAPPGKRGADFLSNAGHADNPANPNGAGHWWGIATDATRRPYIQGAGDPAPGYYVSTTSLQDVTKRIQDCARYVNAQLIPYISLPPQLFDAGVHLGDVGFALYNGKLSNFLVADSGGRGHIGEGSPQFARNLGINDDVRNGGLEKAAVSYIVFPNSGVRKPLSLTALTQQVSAVLAARNITNPNNFESDIKNKT